jgi:hypothetical protein
MRARPGANSVLMKHVQFDARGPAQAKCSCPATNVCQHILAAALFLQRAISPAEPAPQAASSGSGPAEPVAEPGSAESVAGDGLAAVQEELLRTSIDQLIKHAGKAGYRSTIDSPSCYGALPITLSSCCSGQAERTSIGSSMRSPSPTDSLRP